MFQVDAVECWLVQQPEPEDAPPPGKAGGSVLDRCARSGCSSCYHSVNTSFAEVVACCTHMGI